MKIIRTIFRFLLLIFLLLILNFFYKGVVLYHEVIKEDTIEDTIKSIREKDSFILVDEVNPMFLDAIISVEDHRFYEHAGFDIISFSKAVIRDVKERRFASGGSTITQQVSKNLFFSFEKKISRKVAEYIVAKTIESSYEKEEILALYINIIYYGLGSYGINDAANIYFDKMPNELTDLESIILAGLPKAPSVYSSDRELIYKRTLDVLNAMEKYKKINNEQKNKFVDKLNKKMLYLDKLINKSQ